MPEKTGSETDASRLPDGAGHARLIVCERLGHWAAALRRELHVPELRVYETRSLAECWEMLAGHPASFVVAELTRPAVQALLDRIVRLGKEFPPARAAVVAERDLAPCEWLVRESGAVHFCVSPREAGPLARLAVRHLEAAPQPERTLVQQIWDELPWG
jgi:hypothetical protein